MWPAASLRCLTKKRWEARCATFWQKPTPEVTPLNSAPTCRCTQLQRGEGKCGRVTVRSCCGCGPVTLMRGDSSLKLKPPGYNSISDVLVIGTGRPVPAGKKKKSSPTWPDRRRCRGQSLEHKLTPSFFSSFVNESLSPTWTANG